jgi:hypothetical protein
MIAICYHGNQTRRHKEFIILFILIQLGRYFNGNQLPPIENGLLLEGKI